MLYNPVPSGVGQAPLHLEAGRLQERLGRSTLGSSVYFLLGGYVEICIYIYMYIYWSGGTIYIYGLYRVISGYIGLYYVFAVAVRTSAERAVAPACIWGSVGIFRISFGRSGTAVEFLQHLKTLGIQDLESLRMMA